MKKLLCVLLFGLVFGQDAITTREFQIPYDSNDGISEYNLSELFNLNSESYYIQFNSLSNIDCTIPSLTIGLEVIMPVAIPVDGEEAYGLDQYIQIYNYNVVNIGGEGGVGSAFLYNANDPISLRYTQEDEQECTLEVKLWLTGRFEDTDTSLNGDMNGDGTLDVLDVVSLVQEILNGGMGDVGDLLNIVRG